MATVGFYHCFLAMGWAAPLGPQRRGHRCRAKGSTCMAASRQARTNHVVENGARQYPCHTYCGGKDACARRGRESCPERALAPSLCRTAAH
eukprot:scaffold131301_cov32-Tisochrysis_lutea.AAC.12